MNQQLLVLIKDQAILHQQHYSTMLHRYNILKTILFSLLLMLLMVLIILI